MTEEISSICHSAPALNRKGSICLMIGLLALFVSVCVSVCVSVRASVRANVRGCACACMHTGSISSYEAACIGIPEVDPDL